MSDIEHKINNDRRAFLVTAGLGAAAMALGISSEAEAEGLWMISHGMVITKKDGSKKSAASNEKRKKALIGEYDRLIADTDLNPVYRTNLIIERTKQGNYVLVSPIALPYETARLKAKRIANNTSVPTALREYSKGTQMHPPPGTVPVVPVKTKAVSTPVEPAEEEPKETPKQEPEPAKPETPPKNPEYPQVKSTTFQNLQMDLELHLGKARNNDVVPQDTTGFVYVKLLGRVDKSVKNPPVNWNSSKGVSLELATPWESFYVAAFGQGIPDDPSPQQLGKIIEKIYDHHAGKQKLNQLLKGPAGALSSTVPKGVQFINNQGTRSESAIFSPKYGAKAHPYLVVAGIQGKVSDSVTDKLLSQFSQMIYDAIDKQFNPQRPKQ